MYDYMVLGQFLPAHLPSRQLHPPDNCPPDYSHLGKLPPWAIPPDNSHLGLLYCLPDNYTLTITAYSNGNYK